MSCENAELLTRSEIKKLSYKNIKSYVKQVGLAFPKHVTKGNCLKLLFKEKKFIEDTFEKTVEEVCSSSIEYKKGLSSPKSSIDSFSPKTLRNFSSSESSEAEENIKRRPTSGSIVINDDFLSSGSKEVNNIIKQMKREFPSVTDLQHFRAIQNCIYQLKHLNADELSLCIENNDAEGIGRDVLTTLSYNMSRLNFVRWTSAINVVDLNVIDLANCKEKFQKFFTFIKITNVYDKIRSMGRVQELQSELHDRHEFTHYVYTALTEIISEPDLIRYLMSVLLFCRVADSRQISLSNIGLNWTTNKDPTSLHLLKRLMINVSKHMTAGLMVGARFFDQIDNGSKKRKVTRKAIGGLMVEHFRTQNKDEEMKNETRDEEAESGLPKVSKPMSKLMSEMRSTVVELRAVVDEGVAKEKARRKEDAEKKSKETESMKNIRAIEFCVPKNNLQALKRDYEDLMIFLDENIFIQKHFVSDEFSLSLNRLEETNDEILELWKETERTYLRKTRTQFLRQIADPCFQAVYEVLLDVYAIELSDDLWGEIWAFRQPFEKKVDLRYAVEVFLEFKEKYGIE